jgi:hypothetical protein
VSVHTVHIGNFVTTVIHLFFQPNNGRLCPLSACTQLCPTTLASAYRHPRPSIQGSTFPEGTPPYLSTGNFYFITLADIFSPEYFLPLCYRTPPYYWERTSSVCIMHLYSVYDHPPTLILPAYFYLSLYAHPSVLSIWRAISIWRAPSSFLPPSSF